MAAVVLCLESVRLQEQEGGVSQGVVQLWLTAAMCRHVLSRLDRIFKPELCLASFQVLKFH